MKFRENDRHGSGAYRASRGSRLHNGVDICCEEGEPIKAVSQGRVTKIGYPYSQGPNQDPKKKALRYVQVTDSYGLDVRYFYVSPLVEVGDSIDAGSEIGIAQGLARIYDEITEHYHFEVLRVVKGKKVFCDPEQYLTAIA